MILCNNFVNICYDANELGTQACKINYIYF